MKGSYLTTYPAHFARLSASLQGDELFSTAVGGNFLASGKLQYALLANLGLGAEDFVLDVGCGSGRLACHLAHLPQLRYLGTDIVPELLQQARRITQRPDWEFHLTDGTSIPCANGVADFVCFFSVFTHLKHEETYRYLRKARRVLRADGKIVFSFLEFKIPAHWAVFQAMIDHGTATDHLNQFMDRDAIRAFAHYLDLQIQDIWSGGIPHIPFDGEVVWDDGRVQTGMGDIGHSVCVLTKR
jgi:ubiquinone/menaquinone biosynthesis C-methylase UbiE